LFRRMCSLPKLSRLVAAVGILTGIFELRIHSSRLLIFAVLVRLPENPPVFFQLLSGNKMFVPNIADLDFTTMLLLDVKQKFRILCIPARNSFFRKAGKAFYVVI
jgi:hypothetical protein